MVRALKWGGVIVVIVAVYLLDSWLNQPDDKKRKRSRDSDDDDAVVETLRGHGFPEPIPMVGAADAPGRVTLVLDYKCRHSAARYESYLKPLIAAADPNVQIVFRNYPFVHPVESERAARAALAAQRQGKFLAYHEVLLSHQSEQWTDDALVRYADDLELDTERFRADLADPAIARHVAIDKGAARLARVPATPLLFINGQHIDVAQLIGYVGDEAAATFVQLAARRGAEAKEALAKGTAPHLPAARSLRGPASRGPTGLDMRTFERLYLYDDVREIRAP